MNHILFPLLTSLALLATAPVDAGPVSAPMIKSQSQAVDVRDRGHGRGNWHGNRNWNGNRNLNRNNNWGRHGHWRHGNSWSNDGYWPRWSVGPSLGFYFGVPLFSQPYAGTYYRPRPVYRTTSSNHVNWCFQRYRSYRAYDNTFQPYNGPRQECRSPYW